VVEVQQLVVEQEQQEQLTLEVEEEEDTQHLLTMVERVDQV
jgi:hypothetical protein